MVMSIAARFIQHDLVSLVANRATQATVLLALVVFSLAVRAQSEADDDGWMPVGTFPTAASAPRSLLKESVEADWEVIEYKVDDVRETVENQSSSLTQQREDLNAAERVREAFSAMSSMGSRPIVASHIAKTVKLDMFVGQVDVLGVVKVKRVAVGNGSVVRAEVLESGELLVIGKSAGSSSLRLWHSDGSQSDFNIRVSESDPETRVRMEKMVRMKVRMVDFRKSSLEQVGIDWSDSTSGPGLAFAGDVIGNPLFRPVAEGLSETLPNIVDPFATYFGIASNITSSINMLAANGDAITLAEPVLSCRSGGEASFLAGGEVPYPTTGQNGQTIVEFKEYGIRLNISPVVDELGNVRAIIETEISQLDQASSIGDTPGLLTRRATTEVNVANGETIVISGLLNSDMSEDVDSIPGLGRLPILGHLFRSSNRRDAAMELVVFVTPEVVDPVTTAMSARHQQILANTNLRMEEAGRRIDLME